MRALIFSDLHLAHNDLDYDLDAMPPADIAVVAGDVSAPVTRSMRWLHREVVGRGLPVIFVAGNHEHYNFDLKESLADGLSARSKFPGVHFLENEAIVINGIRYLGCTLWTDYDLYHRPEEAMKSARLGLNDHKLITMEQDGEWPLLRPEDVLAIHWQSRTWLEAELSLPFGGKTVVVTHHAPHPHSIHLNFVGDRLNPAFVSDLSDIIGRYQPDLWVHGHVHHNHDYRIGATRVLCNPRGYARSLFSGKEIENPAFEPFLMVQI